MKKRNFYLHGSRFVACSLKAVDSGMCTAWRHREDSELALGLEVTAMTHIVKYSYTLVFVTRLT